MLFMFRGKVDGLPVVAALPAHGYSNFKIELQVTGGLDELFELVDIL